MVSKQEETMVQCHLVGVGRHVGSHYTCWLPSEVAVVNKFVDVDVGNDGVFLTFRVQKTWTELPTPVVRERSQDYKRTRKASDI